MTKTRTFKRTLTFILALSMLLCCVSAFGSVQASAATDRVSMYLCDAYSSRYGTYCATVYIQTKGNASNQSVYLHYNDGYNSDWKDIQASYFTTLSDGSKIWQASIAGDFDMQYAVKYIADGQTFWDNNNGKNYNKEKIGTAPITATRSVYYGTAFGVAATLQNYGYSKNVQVRYTEDNWATYKDVPLTYQSTNSDGTENWLTKLELDRSKSESFQFSIYYKVNGQTYWANNFGKNYNYQFMDYPTF